jgi:hypothetical protein
MEFSNHEKPKNISIDAGPERDVESARVIEPFRTNVLEGSSEVVLRKGKRA